MAKNFLKSSLQNASFNIIFQVMFRCMTFLMNAFVLRYVGQDVIGVMNVRLLLLESTILFLSREAFRKACLTNTKEHNWAQVINLLWFMVPLCSVLCVLFGWVWLYVLEPPALEITPHYTIGVYAIAISCVIEMCVEPLYLVAQAFLFVRLRTAIDTIHVIVRTSVYTTLVVRWPQGAVVAFSTAQIVAVLVYAACYYIYFTWYLRCQRTQPVSPKKLRRPMSSEDDFPFTYMTEFLPRTLEKQPMVDCELRRLTWSFFKQGIVKQILTEGERYIMTLFSVLTFHEQGVFDVVNNLGSLAARFLFRPIEENAYFYFCQLVNRDKPIDDQNPYEMKEAAIVLQRLLKIVVSLGLVAVSFGQAYARLVLLLYGGPALANGVAPLLLRVHSLAILLLAINGTTEAYASATMDTAHLDKYNYVMAGLSIKFMAVSWFLTRLLGSVGFILANCCNMAARITYSVLFIKRRYQNTVFTPLDGLVPDRMFTITALSSAAITMYSEAYFYDSSKMIHFLVGAICLAVVIITWVVEEQDVVRFGVDRWRRQSLKVE